MATNAASAAPAADSRADVEVAPQPASGTRTSAAVAAPAASVNAATPGRSSRGAPGDASRARGSRSATPASAIVTAAIGRLTKKIHRHESPR